MDSAVIGQVLTAAGGGVAIKTVFDFVKDRRKLKSQAKVQEGTESAQVAIGNVGALQANQAYLQSIIDSMARRETEQENDLAAEKAENTRLRRRTFELEDEVQRLKIQAQEMGFQARMMQDKCDNLTARISEIGGQGGRERG